MGKKLSNPPVYYTLAQVQFNPILNLDDYVPKIQAEMRGIGFPDYKKEAQHRLVINPNITNQSAPSVLQEFRNSFGDISGKTRFVLDANALTFETSNYETYETFVGAFINGLGIVHAILNLAYSERIGIRYFDAVFPLNNDDLNEYLVSEVRGTKDRIQASFIYTYNETVTSNEIGQLISRVIIREGQIALPDDLSYQPLKFATKFSGYTGMHAIIDSDAFSMDREPFDVQNIQGALAKLHTYVGNSFKATVSDYALKVWA